MWFSDENIQVAGARDDTRSETLVQEEGGRLDKGEECEQNKKRTKIFSWPT